MTAYAGPRIAALCAAMHAHSAAHLREDVAPLSPLIGLSDLPPAVMDEIHEAVLRLRDSYAQACTDGMREGSVRELQHEAFIAIFPSLYQWLPKWLHLLGAEDRNAAPQELAELMRVGLLP
ncbi:hypothetical protein D3C78_1546080 [compost metagenome]